MAEALPANGSSEGDEQAREAAHLASQLEAVFGKIERERMSDVPILNRSLSVAAIGMRPFNGAWLSALVTPWFINVMLLPGSLQAGEAWSGAQIGTKVKHQLPAGIFEFICGVEDGLGPYQMCSLFSPVLEFQDQEAAIATAKAALTALFDESLNPAYDKSREAVAPADPVKGDAARVSRRNLIFGAKSPEGRT
jgi:[NiFe] hydrogenase assembly HybE family chaperone